MRFVGDTEVICIIAESRLEDEGLLYGAQVGLFQIEPLEKFH